MKTKDQQYNEYLNQGGTMSIVEWEKDGRFDRSLANKKSGGARPGAGRKPLYNEPTTPVQFECPVSKKDEFKANARKLLAAYRVTKSPPAPKLPDVIYHDKVSP